MYPRQFVHISENILKTIPSYTLPLFPKHQSHMNLVEELYVPKAFSKSIAYCILRTIKNWKARPTVKTFGLLQPSSQLHACCVRDIFYNKVQMMLQI